MYEKLIWFIWLKYVIKSFFKGELKERLVLQPANGKSLSIVVNGPSVNRTIQYLKPGETDVMMVNNAPLTPLYKELCPKYVCFSDSEFLEENKRNFSIRTELMKTADKVTIFLPSYFIKQTFFPADQLNIKYVFSLFGTSTRYNFYSYKLMEKNFLAPAYNNVVIMCLYVGIQLGYKKIYLYGADENFLKQITVDQRNRVMRENVHYYGSEMMCENKKHGADMEIMTYMMYRIFNGLKRLKKYAAKENVRVINMSDDSWVDCFPRYVKEKKD